MGLIGSIVGGGVSAIGGALAAKNANKAYQQAIDTYEKRSQELKDHRDALYYQDPTQSAENQAAVTNAKKVLAENTKNVAARNAVAGGTDESVALANKQASEAVGNMLQQQAVQGEQRKENVWNTADQQLGTMTQYIANARMQKGLNGAKAITDAASGLSDAANTLL